MLVLGSVDLSRCTQFFYSSTFRTTLPRSYVLLGTSVEAPCPPMVRRKMRVLRVGAAQGNGGTERLMNFASLQSWESKGTPPMPPPRGNKALLRDY